MAFAAVRVGIENEASRVDAFQQDRASGRFTTGSDGRHGHRVGVGWFAGLRFDHPTVEPSEWIGLGLIYLGHATPGSFIALTQPCDCQKTSMNLPDVRAYWLGDGYLVTRVPATTEIRDTRSPVSPIFGHYLNNHHVRVPIAQRRAYVSRQIDDFLTIRRFAGG